MTDASERERLIADIESDVWKAEDIADVVLSMRAGRERENRLAERIAAQSAELDRVRKELELIQRIATHNGPFSAGALGMIGDVVHRALAAQSSANRGGEG